MITRVHTSDSPAYVPLIHKGNEPADRSAMAQPSGTKDDPQANGLRKTEEPAKSEKPVASASSTRAKTQLDDAELNMVRELKQRDQKVRQHEQAHISASGGLAQGGPNYSYQRGPDGQNYAVGGHVKLDVSPGKTAEETLKKAQTIRTAAMAPADPSGQDRTVAAKATQMSMKAQTDLIQQQAMERNRQSGRDDDSPAGRLAQRFFSAITPQAEPSLQVAA